MIFSKNKFLSQGYSIIDVNKAAIIKIRIKIIELFNNYFFQKHNFKSINENKIIELYYSKYKKDVLSVIDQISFFPEIYQLANDKNIIKIIKKTGINFPVVGFNNLGGRGGVPFLNFFPKDHKRYYKAHQDFFYLPGSLNSVVLWIPLQNTLVSNGTIKVIPGSHQNNHLMAHSAKDAKKNKLSKKYSEKDFKNISVKQGQAILFSSFLIHKSGQNSSKKMRMAFQIRYNDLLHKEYINRGLSFDKFPEKIKIEN